MFTRKFTGKLPYISVCKHIPDCPETWQEITIHHLLSQATGLPGEFPDFDSWNNVDGHPEAGHPGFYPGFYTQVIGFPEDDLVVIWLNNNEPPIDPFEPVKEIAMRLFSK